MLGLSYMPGHWLLNKTISAARSAWYQASDKTALILGRIGWVDAPLPLVSVYIPTHNRRELLIQRSIKSVLRQSYRNTEVIVVGHGCTDGTNLAVIGEFFKDGRVRYVSIPRRETYPPTVENHWCAGRVVPANVGLSECRGEWIATNDDDDIWTDDHIESLLKLARAGDYEFVSGAHEANGLRVPPYDLSGVRVGGIQTWLYRSYLKSFKFNPDCWRKTWNKVCDTDLQDRFRKAGVRMGYLDKVVTNILPRPGESSIGLAAAKANKDKYLKHLTFK